MSVFFVLLGHDRLPNGWNDLGVSPTQTLYPNWLQAFCLFDRLAKSHESGPGARAPAALALAVIHLVSPILTLQYPRTIFEPQGIILLSLYFYLNNATSP
jgi:hypothetical protein